MDVLCPAPLAPIKPKIMCPPLLAFSVFSVPSLLVISRVALAAVGTFVAVVLAEEG